MSAAPPVLRPMVACLMVLRSRPSGRLAHFPDRSGQVVRCLVMLRMTCPEVFRSRKVSDFRIPRHCTTTDFQTFRSAEQTVPQGKTSRRHEVTDVPQSEIASLAGYSPANHTLTYTSAGKTQSVTEGTNKVLNFEYGIDDQRFKME
jgi:hypothetical protein